MPLAWAAVPAPRPSWQVEQVTPAMTKCLAWAAALLGAAWPLGGVPWHEVQPVGATAGLVAWQRMPLMALGLIQLTAVTPPERFEPWQPVQLVTSSRAAALWAIPQPEAWEPVVGLKAAWGVASPQPLARGSSMSSKMAGRRKEITDGMQCTSRCSDGHGTWYMMQD